MKLYTLCCNHKEIVAVKGENEQLYSLSSLGIDVPDMNTLILKWDSLESLIQNRLAHTILKPLQKYSLLAPITSPMQDIICLGINYYEHRKETADIADFTKQADTVYFSKRVNGCTGPDGVIPHYDFVEKLDYEVELGVILKKDAFQVSVADAANYIFGYTIINDISARDIQLKHQQWYLGKSLDGYTPMGPCIVTADELRNPHNLSLQCYVNGELRQNSNTKYMITSVEEAIAELSQGMTLKAGTIIATGTPGGVGMGMNPPVFLKSKDQVCCEIEQIGKLHNIIS